MIPPAGTLLRPDPRQSGTMGLTVEKPKPKDTPMKKMICGLLAVIAMSG